MREAGLAIGREASASGRADLGPTIREASARACGGALGASGGTVVAPVRRKECEPSGMASSTARKTSVPRCVAHSDEKSSLRRKGCFRVSTRVVNKFGGGGASSGDPSNEENTSP